MPFAIVLAFPFFWMAITSLKHQGDVYNPTKTWSFDPTLENYGYLFHHTGYLRWIRNSCFVGLVVTLITLVVAVPAGYALARLAGRIGRGLGVAIFLTYLVPPTLLFLPFSRVVAELDLQDRLWALILVYPSFTIPFAIWLLMGFFKSVPQELEDAALMDGCSRLGALVRIVLPVSVPGILTVVIFTFSLVAERVRLRDHVHHELDQPHADGRRSDRPDPRRPLQLARDHGGDPDPGHPAGPDLQRVPQPLHRGVHRRGIPIAEPKRKDEDDREQGRARALSAGASS